MCLICLCVSLVLVNIVYRQLLIPQPPLSLPPQQQFEPWELPSAHTKIHAISVFKEESHALVEVLLNLYSQGVDHVLLIDNMSEHELPMDVLNLMSEMGFVTLKHQRGQMIQKPAFRWATQWSRWHGADWILHFDMDEFPYATQLGSVQSYLALRDPEVCSVAFPWRLFASDGRDEQPNSIVHGFVGRFNFTKQRAQTTAYKTAARTSCSLLWMAIHHAAMLPRDSLRGYAATSGFPRQDSPKLDARTEEIVPDVLINHYRVQSRQFFLQIKQHRGLPNNNGKKRDEKSFRGGDKNDISDYHLIHKVDARFPSLYYGQQQHDGGPGDHDLALQPNTNFTSPWPLSNVKAALQELKRHQVLVIMDADTSLPDVLAKATRNAAILDPTLDCVVRVPPGHVRAVQNSQVLQFCKAYEAFPETSTDTPTQSSSSSSWNLFVQARIQEYSDKYQGFAIMDVDVRLAYGMETAPLRRAAIAAAAAGTTPLSLSSPSSSWQIWTPPEEGMVEAGTIRVVGNLKQ